MAEKTTQSSSETGYKSPIRKLSRFFESSRDKWKHKCKEAKYQVKILKNRVRFLENSKAELKNRVNELEKELKKVRKVESDNEKKTV